MTSRTIFGMMVTPFTPGNRLDEPALRAHLRRMVGAGVGVYLGAGGAGEGHALSTDELQRVFEIGVEECRGKVPTCGTIPEARTGADTLARCRLAMDAGVEVIQVFFPDAGHGMRPRASEQERFYRELLSTIDYPIALSAHANSGFLPSIALLRALCSDYPHVVAINAMRTPLSYLVDLIDTLGPRVQVYTQVKDLANGLLLGANGCLAAEPNVVPNMCMRVLTSFENGNIAAFGEAFAQLLRFNEVVNRWAPSTARWVKMAMRVFDLPAGAGPIREPYMFPWQDEMDEMNAAFEELSIRELEGIA